MCAKYVQVIKYEQFCTGPDNIIKHLETCARKQIELSFIHQKKRKW